MLCFGIGTLPALMLTSGLAASLRTLLQQRHARAGAAALLLVFALWTLQGVALPILGGAPMHGHGHAARSAAEHSAEMGAEADCGDSQ